jgi:hypothetical protein
MNDTADGNLSAREARGKLRRIAARSDPATWGEDELLTLAEAAALFWPDGPLTVTSLRTAVRDGQLRVAPIAGKFLTSKRAVMEMSVSQMRTGATARRPRTKDMMMDRIRRL